jgi:flagellar biosynthesis/type III secretory pathway chaperone
MNILAELEDVLEEERRLLISGRISAIQELVERKAKLSKCLARERPAAPVEVYRRLSWRAERNKALLEAAQRGLQAAMAQVKQAASATDQTTYSRTGDRLPLARTRSSIAQKI